MFSFCACSTTRSWTRQSLTIIVIIKIIIIIWLYSVYFLSLSVFRPRPLHTRRFNEKRRKPLFSFFGTSRVVVVRNRTRRTPLKAFGIFVCKSAPTPSLLRTRTVWLLQSVAGVSRLLQRGHTSTAGKKTVSMEPLRRAGVSSQWNSSADMSVHVYFIILFSGLHCLVCVHGIGFSTRRKTFFVPIVYLYRRFWGIQSCVAIMYISKRLICLRKYFESKRRRQCRRKCIIYIYTTCCVYVPV